MDLIRVAYRVFDWRISRAIFHFILFYLVFASSQIHLYQKFDKLLFERGPLISNNIRECSYPNRHCSVSGNYNSNFSVFSSSICGSRNRLRSKSSTGTCATISAGEEQLLSKYSRHVFLVKFSDRTNKDVAVKI